MKDRKQNGFTLIEIIIALVMFSIMAVMITSFSLNVPGSVSPVINLRRSTDLQRGMDNITRAYYNLAPLPITHASLDTFRTAIIGDPTYINVTGVTVDNGRTKFVTFPGAGNVRTESDDASANAPNLKVTLVNSGGQRVSTIFTTR